MNEIIKNGSAFVGYEYKEIVTNANKISFLIDGYKSFGWIIDENFNNNLNISRHLTNANEVIRFKRNRKIVNKMELTRLQRNFEFCLKEIDHFEKSKTSKATMYALILGIIGTVFMTGSVFAVSADPPNIALCIVMAIPAFVGWILPYFVYRNVVREKSEKFDILIEEKQEEIYEICEKGNKLLY
jgi:hypothetical protein